jgi:hypothetical protein
VLGDQPGGKVPALQRRGASADEVAHLCCCGELRDGPTRNVASCRLGLVAGGGLTLESGSGGPGCGYRHSQVPPLRDRPPHKPHPRLWLTVMLALLYFGGVSAIQALFGALTGQEEQPQLAIVVSTLVIAALFNPLRRRIQSFIDRSFYRRKYDASKTLEAFSAKLRDETDLDALRDDLVGIVAETMLPAHVSLWLRPDPEPEDRSVALSQFGHE